ncbi:MAG: hypothetical protein RMJ33_11675 [Saprospiraceae bacterium]|nr:hypothetical protein [Saprospiraceae bacterium]MDW8230489.1 hypothetical protein [Saprospiraceae bacterium]
MKTNWKTRYGWVSVLALLPLFYALFYGRYGINETDGGFLTGLAWQVLSGKVLYADIVYVRPPLPVWMRVLELFLLPESWAVWGERLLFYYKVAIYCVLGVAVLLPSGRERWQVAVLAFLLSAHHYPAAAWHTVDGLFWGALGFWWLFRFSSYPAAVLAGVLLSAAMLCKQSFYPLAVIGIGTAAWAYAWRRGAAVAFGLALGWSVFAVYLKISGLWEGFWRMTTGAASLAQAWQHGVLDYFRIRPWLAVVSALLLAATVWFDLKKPRAVWAFSAWAIWLLVLGVAFVWEVRVRCAFVAPFAQARLLFWVSNAYAFWCWQRGEWSSSYLARYAALAALSWCAAVSWGYNLPILFSAPWAFALWDISRRLSALTPDLARYGSATVSLLLFLAFYQGYKWVYRDGARDAMTAPLGQTFPALYGIYTTPTKAALYADLAALAKRYGPNFTVLPAFPQANFLTRTRPPLPLDWVVRREMGPHETFVEAEARRTKPILFLEKTALPTLNADPELALVKRLYRQGQVLEETPHFIVFRLP